jgi:hypothetical protein
MIYKYMPSLFEKNILLFVNSNNNDLYIKQNNI